MLTVHAQRHRTALDSERIDANYADGVLTLRLPVAEKAKPPPGPDQRSRARPHAINAQSDELGGAAS